MDGWVPGILQKAVDTCTQADGVIEECAVLHFRDSAKTGRCKKVRTFCPFQVSRFTLNASFLCRFLRLFSHLDT